MQSDVERSEHAVQRLKDLPSELQPPFEWHEFERRARERSARHTYRIGRSWLAAAAFFAALVAGIALWGRLLPGTDNMVTVDATEPQSYTFTVPIPNDSSASERWLAQLPPEPAIVRVDTRVAVTELEDRIAWVDEMLTSERLEGAQLRINALQHERAVLVNSLAQVRYVETLAAELP